ncbi:hypothetical protein [Lihuaxuella thermophila]|uniref:Uncharacterized protein n=1 Tax=Lihuaxuella thermophila TaxID=1173111 RepID=A0A1H8JLJ9_9BACL|nr:hypothetical protein [Lihuaxuella thermophila]SEN81206.1 hypothetical protein SAMN05444955_1287 [Lihuaxuella thermophila]
MENPLIIGIVVAIVIAMAMIVIPLQIWAEKSKNTFIRLVILGPIYIRMLFEEVEGLVNSINDQKYFLAFFYVLVIFAMSIVFIIAINERWLFNLIRKKKTKKKQLQDDDDEISKSNK